MLYRAYDRNRLFVSMFAIVFLVIFFFCNNTSKQSFEKVSSVPKRRYVFFDLGVNNGDSLLSFFEMKSKGIAYNLFKPINFYQIKSFLFYKRI